MNRPLLICDCDEVILHMVSHFRAWLAEDHRIAFDFTIPDWSEALTFDDGSLVPEEKIWPLLGGFFEDQMHRQTLVPGAKEALDELKEVGEVVILTNIGSEAQGLREKQLADHGLFFDVIGNRGGKGRPVLDLLKKHDPSHAVFVDDLAVQHGSVAKHAPGVKRLHMVSEPELAGSVAKAEHAHARIDDWGEATQWILRQWERA